MSFLHGEEKIQREPHHSFPVLEGWLCRWWSLFTKSHTEGTRGNAYKLHWEMLHLDILWKFFTVRKINHWSNLPWDMVESPSLEFFKMIVDKVLNNVIWAPFPMKVWTS